jgi:hypothetical protein
MYAEGRSIGKSEQRSRESSREIGHLRVRPANFTVLRRGPAGSWPAPNLYEHIIILDAVRGECYGRIQSAITIDT